MQYEKLSYKIWVIRIVFFNKCNRLDKAQDSCDSGDQDFSPRPWLQFWNGSISLSEFYMMLFLIFINYRISSFYHEIVIWKNFWQCYPNKRQLSIYSSLWEDVITGWPFGKKERTVATILKRLIWQYCARWSLRVLITLWRCTGILARVSCSNLFRGKFFLSRKISRSH